ncbi:MAG TPA: hypothetical protein VNK04_12325 [Gemmataceae bacterium]|nr:hypothetical protein [Gemmataceae bacterium]
MPTRLSSLSSSWRWVVLLSALGSLSCAGGNKLNPVKGQVFYKGQPLKGALVTFHPKGAVDEVSVVRPTGLTKEDGSFTLTTGNQEGAPAGEYIVTLICPEEVTPKRRTISTEAPDSRDRFQGAYADRTTSRLTAQIKPGPNQLEPFHLK